MSKEKLKAKEILDRAYVDVSIANLEQRKRQIIEDTERFLADELPANEPDGEYEEYEEYGAGEYDNDVRLDWNYEETEDWDDEDDV